MLEILDPGLYCSLQDEGRVAQGDIAVPFSGAMDRQSLHLANHILQNDLNASCLEFASPGPTLKFHYSTTITITGAKAFLVLNGKSIAPANNAILSLKPDDVIKIKTLESGSWAYLGIVGGFDSEKVLGSQSLSPGITVLSGLLKGNTINYSSQDFLFSASSSRVKPAFPWEKVKVLKVRKGPEFSLLPEEIIRKLRTDSFSFTSERNRMAAPIHELLPANRLEILTSPIFPGMVQLTPGGKMILLLMEAQITGGYPRILFMEEPQRNLAVQMKPGQKFMFEIV
ncbi:biotin-dependent carboxyltransferase family protein [Litoribacter ruber]|uniref:5-oxoprolinase subunit C family protein n=1 Tax=Litoribacter ruber TaxID=702568 RepID=UPI001BDAA9B5|nr:biotin-dependent carboxyltransferase family protein [Litoribacter ruber]MBT0810423.1 biotin-dependent carboxyltransferase family protein [Litoribacter ruber]